MGSDISGMYVVLGPQEGGGVNHIRRRHLSRERVFGSNPGRRRSAPIVMDHFDLSHLDWQNKANCRDTDPDVFFPSKGMDGVPAKVRAICDACPVQQTCLEYALADPGIEGIWGGCGDEERNRIRRRRSKSRRDASRRVGA